MIKKNFKTKSMFIYVLCILALMMIAPLALHFTMHEAGAASYSITTEQQFKDWALNTNSTQTNNPNAVLANDIELTWDRVVAPQGDKFGSAYIHANSVLNGQNHTISLRKNPSANNKTYPDVTLYQAGMFLTGIAGKVEYLNLTLSTDFNIIIDYMSASNNGQFYMGLFCAKLEHTGIIDHCNIYVNKNIKIETEEVGTGGTAIHFGVIAGGMWGACVISNTKVIQSPGTVIQAHVYRGWVIAYGYVRIGMIVGDPYKEGNNKPLVKNVYVERAGTINMRNPDGTGGSEIFGNVVADLDTGGDAGNHYIDIDGVILNLPIGSGIDSGIVYYSPHHRAVRSYVIGGFEKNATNFTVKNIYVLQNDLNNGSMTNVGCGYTYLPTGFEYGFENDKVKVSLPKNEQTTNFIWDITKTADASTTDFYTQFSPSVLMEKVPVTANVGKDNWTIVKGEIIKQATFGFASAEVEYTGETFPAIFTIKGQEIKEGFTVNCQNNKDSFVTSGTNATCDLVYPEVESGVFIHTSKYYIDKTNIDFTNATMKILPKPLKINYIPGDIYTNKLTIIGLAGQEKLDINSTAYADGIYHLDCENNDITKTISFKNGTIETNYNITREGFSGNQFQVQPKTIAIQSGISVTNTDGVSSKVADNNLLIYSRNYKTIALSFLQPEGYLNSAVIKTSANTEFNVENVLEGTTMKTTITPYIENDYKYINEITLSSSLQKVVLKVNNNFDGELTINSGETYFDFGDYYIYGCDYGDEVSLTVTLPPEQAASVKVVFYINGVQQQVEGKTLTVLAKGDTYNEMNITIELTPISQ